ncbi:MAG: T9SS type A sorting domain-containing protein [Candidatus Delongbacteria bacterium]|nr:T9SS type A sorting domain-containing protein [Candidatus Delongbacteria bacterium]
MKNLILIAVLLAFSFSLYAGLPRQVYVNIIDCQGNAFDFSEDNSGVFFDMWIKDRPDEIINQDSFTPYMSHYLNHGFDDTLLSVLIANVGNFPTPWNEGDSLCFEVKHVVEGGHYEPYTKIVKFYLFLDESIDTIWYGFEPWIPDTGEPVALTRFKSDDSDIESNIPNVTKLEQNYPNPFNPNTAINFSIVNEGIVNLNVYNLSGQLISELVNEVVNAGMHSVNFDASDLSAGVYYYILEADNQVLSNKMILLK